MSRNHKTEEKPQREKKKKTENRYDKTPHVQVNKLEYINPIKDMSRKCARERLALQDQHSGKSNIKKTDFSKLPKAELKTKP